LVASLSPVANSSAAGATHIGIKDRVDA
jgi:hypothetical protein